MPASPPEKAKPFPVPAASAGTSLPAWLVQLRAERSAALHVVASERAYREATGGRVASLPAERGRTTRTNEAEPVSRTSLDEANAELRGMLSDGFFASPGEAVFFQAGVVAPPEGLKFETRHDSGEGV